jgi:serine protease Do
MMKSTMLRPSALSTLVLTLSLVPAAGCGSANPSPGLAEAGRQAAQDSGGLVVRVSGEAQVPTASTVADLVDRVSSTVVNITTVTHLSSQERGGHPFEFFFPEGAPGPTPRERKGAGTGFIIDKAGFVITNAHVVQGADEVNIRTRDDTIYTANVVGRDRKLDLALLKITGVRDLPSVVLGDSDTLRVGENVLAVGNPFGLGHTVTMGIVSAKARSIGAGPYDDFIQTDASINPGNSGGPLFNLRGQVVGINTAIRAGADGIGFAIPVNALKDIVNQLEEKGFVERGKLGLAFQPVTPELAKALKLDRPHGALVSEVIGQGSAARAGIKSGDIIVGVGDTEIHRSEELPKNVARHAPGSTIDVHLLRGGKKLTLRAKLDKLEDEEAVPRPQHPSRSAPKTRESMLGLELQNAPGGGVRIVRLTRPQEGLAPGDLIVEVNSRKVRNVDELRAALRDGSAEAALLKIRRGDNQRFVGVPLKD